MKENKKIFHFKKRYCYAKQKIGFLIHSVKVKTSKTLVYFSTNLYIAIKYSFAWKKIIKKLFEYFNKQQYTIKNAFTTYWSLWLALNPEISLN